MGVSIGKEDACVISEIASRGESIVAHCKDSDIGTAESVLRTADVSLAPRYDRRRRN